MKTGSPRTGNPLSLEPFVYRAKAAPAKRSGKGYGDENDQKSARFPPLPRVRSSSPLFQGRSAGSFPEQRLVIELNICACLVLRTCTVDPF